MFVRGRVLKGGRRGALGAKGWAYRSLSWRTRGRAGRRCGRTKQCAVVFAALFARAWPAAFAYVLLLSFCCGRQREKCDVAHRQGFRRIPLGLA
jgi:hypothetical protein